LQKAYSEGSGINDKYSYSIVMYQHKYTVLVAITDNSARVVWEDFREQVYFGQITRFVQSKTVLTVLGSPHSNCNGSTDYRQVNCVEDCDKKALKTCALGYGLRSSSPDYTKLSDECKSLWSRPEIIITKCNQECPVECKQVSFESKRTDIELNTDMMMYFNSYKSIVSKKFNISKYSDDEFKKRMVVLLIRFDKLETTEITQSASISLTSLIANVGGLLA